MSTCHLTRHGMFPFHCVQNDPEFLELYKSYNYPDEVSPCFVESLEAPLSEENYKSKYHKLVYLEEIESSRRVIRE